MYDATKDNGIDDRLVFIVPKEQQEQVKNVVKAVLGDDYMEDDMLIHEYESVCSDNTDNMQELFQCKKDKNILADELHNRMDNASKILKAMLENVKNNCTEDYYKLFCENLTEKDIAMYGLADVLPKERKYKIIDTNVCVKVYGTIPLLIPYDEDETDYECEDEYLEEKLDDVINELDPDYILEKLTNDYSTTELHLSENEAISEKSELLTREEVTEFSFYNMIEE